jgi:hypothetical protein
MPLASLILADSHAERLLCHKVAMLDHREATGSEKLKECQGIPMEGKPESI